jgi:energy-coupling factor transport system permease protein
LLLLFLTLVLSLEIPFSVLWNGIRKAWVLVALTFVIHVLVSGRGTVSFGDILNTSSSHYNYARAAFFTLRLVLILSVSLGMAYLFSASELARVVARSLRRVSRKMAAQTELLILLALQFVPFLELENRRLQLALAARGQDLGATRIGKVRSLKRTMMPLLVNAFRRADHVSLAIQARGYNTETVRTSLNSRPVSPLQVLMAIVVVAMCLAAPWI